MTTNTWGNDPFATEDRETVPSLPFPTKGTTYEGKVVRIEPDVQGNVYNKDPSAPKVKATWPSGDPKLSIVITLELPEGERAFWVTKYAKNARFQAVKQAQERLGRPMQEGDTLKVGYTGDDPDNEDRKLYYAKITPGQVDHFAKADEEPPF